ncbi:MAG: Ig-like domain-containing protein, partial [Pseudomonadota bacterium]
SNSGTAVVTATRGDLSGSASIAIPANLASLAITPQAPVITTSVNTQFAATAMYSDIEETFDVTDNVSWTVSNTSVASVDNTLPDKGLLNAFSNSDVTLTVTCGDVSDNNLLEIGDPTIVQSIRFGREDNPFEFEFSGETVVNLEAFARLQTQDEVNITQDVEWTTVRRTTTSLSLSNDTGSKGELTVRGRGSITVRIEYDGDDFDETNSTFNSPTLVINVL